MNEKLERREIMDQASRKLQIMFFIDVPEFVAGIGAGLIICSALLSVYSRCGSLDDLEASKRKLFKRVVDKHS